MDFKSTNSIAMLCCSNFFFLTPDATIGKQTPSSTKNKPMYQLSLTLLFFNLADINECVKGTPCGYNANCTNTDGSYTCKCQSGYDGNGTNCTGNVFPMFPTFIYAIVVL